MRVLSGWRAMDFGEAVTLAFREVGANDVSPEVADLLAHTVDVGQFRGDINKAISSTIRGAYGKQSTWDGDWWCVPIPALRYEGKDVPQIVIETSVCLVAPVRLKTRTGSSLVTLVGSVGKPGKVVLPLSFLIALLDDDLGRFRLLARDGGHTTWEMPGGQQVTLANDFVARLSELFKRKSVAVWLGGFGSQGRSIAPLVVGALLGLRFAGASKPMPAGQEPWSNGQLVHALEGMAFRVTEAREMVRSAAPHLRADMTLEDAIRVVLQEKGREEQQ